MKKFSLLICLGLLLAGQTAFATTYHVYKGAGNVNPNYDNLTSAVQQVNLGTGGDTISIDDSSTYTISATLSINQINTSIVAAAGVNPVLQNTMTSVIALQINRPGCRLGSNAGGAIYLDGAGTARRFVNLACTDASWAAMGASVNTFENLVFQNVGSAINNTSCYLLWLLSDDTVTLAPVGTVVNVRYVQFRFPSGKPTVAVGAGSAYIAIRFHGTQGAVLNVENCRANTFCGYIVNGSTETGARALQWGTINIKNCNFVYDDPAMINYRQMGSPVALWNAGSTAHANGWTLNIDNSYLRSDANNNGIWSRTQVSPSPTAGTRDTSESLGVITLLNYYKNNLTVTNSAIVGCGSGIEINSAHARVGVFNSDIYVPTVAQYTQGYFISVAERSNVAVSTDLQCSTTQCNLYGLNGSRINSGPLGAGSVFTMNTSNDWSPTGAYATPWVVNSCVTPGQNPAYTSLANRDLTVGNSTISAANIGSNRAFNPVVPVELSTFEVR